jgi:hypothetical protein
VDVGHRSKHPSPSGQEQDHQAFSSENPSKSPRRHRPYPNADAPTWYNLLDKEAKVPQTSAFTSPATFVPIAGRQFNASYRVVF